MRVYVPERRAYHRRKRKNGQCDFCSPTVIREQGCRSLEGDAWRVLAAKYPYLEGNVLVVPKRHVTALEDLTSAEWSDLQTTLKKAQKRLGQLFRTRSFNLGLNLGEFSGASIPHLHIQLIPRKENQAFTTLNLFADLYLINLSSKDLKALIEGQKAG